MEINMVGSDLHGEELGSYSTIRFILGLGITNSIWTSCESLGPSMLMIGVLVQH